MVKCFECQEIIDKKYLKCVNCCKCFCFDNSWCYTAMDSYMDTTDSIDDYIKNMIVAKEGSDGYILNIGDGEWCDICFYYDREEVEYER